MQCQINEFSVFFLKVTMLVDWRMSNGSLFHVRGPATVIAVSPILVLCPRNVKRQTAGRSVMWAARQIADVSVTELLM